MDHNAIVYMMDREGRFAGFLGPDEDEATQIGKLRSRIGGHMLGQQLLASSSSSRPGIHRRRLGDGWPKCA